MRDTRFVLLCLVAVLIWQRSPISAQEAVDFQRDVRPILSDKCFACHGPDEKTREADLRLDVRDPALAVLDLENPAESEFVRRIASKDPEQRMPPAASHKELTPEEIQTLKAWISQGAPYQQHWSFRPLTRPQPAASKPSQIDNAIDSFIIAKLPAGMELSPRADEISLVRRLYWDLLGVPPTAAEVQTYLNDQSPQAWDELVNQLLNDTRFGERMAVYWLDLVRYADTIGYHSDTYMEVSAYRDYVIDAFNDNLPFDQFSIEQLAGDLLPDPTEQQLIASGYNRLLQTTEEGGAQPKEYIAIYAADRVRNLSAVWMGLTVGCAQCHDHKYDPITTKDFYSLAAFFADIKERSVGKRDPNFKIVSDEQKAKIESLNKTITELGIERRLQSDASLLAALDAGQKAWELKTIGELNSEQSVWSSPDPIEITTTGEVVLQRQSDGTYLATGANPERGDYRYELQTDRPVQAIRVEIFPDDSFARKEGFSRGNGNVVLSGVEIRAKGKPVKIAKAIADFEQPGWPVSNSLDGNDHTGWAVDGHRTAAEKHTAVFQLAEAIDGDEPTKIEIVLRHQSQHGQHLIGRFRISVSEHADANLHGSLPLAPAIVTALQRDKNERSEQQLRELQTYYRTISPELDEARKSLDDAKKALSQYESSLQTMLITERLDTPRTMRVLPRGNWLDDSGEIVAPAVPAFLPHADSGDQRSNRLDLAQWLFDEQNPLTARTFVNRLWKLFYGRGLSRDLDDLGGQGQMPTHPELLDWLASEFRDSQWDVKHLVRLMVSTQTYAQRSFVSKQLAQRDPNNDWFARQGRWRVDAEFVRDAALQLAGLLQDGVTGGRSVKPYQPEGYWQHLNFPKRTWQPSQGEDLYRRTLYTFWCRTFLHPSLLAFDAPSREECTANRARSNIPQQALALLNDPIYVEASRNFAQRIIAANPKPDERIRWAMQQATSRQPSDAEIDVLRQLYRRASQEYASAQDDGNDSAKDDANDSAKDDANGDTQNAAKALVAVGQSPLPQHIDPVELAVWTQVARAILNAYETTARF